MTCNAVSSCCPLQPLDCVLIGLCCETSCCLQILCSRLKILAMPPGRALRAPFAQAAPDPHQQADLAPVIMKGVWQRDASQKTLRGRVRWAIWMPIRLSWRVWWRDVWPPALLEHVQSCPFQRRCRGLIAVSWAIWPPSAFAVVVYGCQPVNPWLQVLPRCT